MSCWRSFIAALTLLPNLADAQYQKATHPTLIGLEYALVDNDELAANMATALADVGLSSMKLIGEASQWGKMQKGPTQAIDFSTTDRFVREYHRTGVAELIMALKSHSPWASVKQGFFGKQNPTPKPQYRNHYARWVSAIVERYDADGIDDMPGLQRAVRYYEIGSEFSSYEPEPVSEYLAMLEIAYRAAKQSDPESVVMHAAFLTTPIDLDTRNYRQLDQVWRDTPMKDRHHDVADIRAILDRPELFDLVNVHNLGDPYELEHMVYWLNWEMAQRDYRKGVLVSDTIPTSYIAWGPAVRCDREPMGVMIPPATEADRCDLSAFFKRLVDRDADTLAATRRFVAADHVKRALIAADLGIAMINLSFTTDLPLLTGKLGQAGAGISGWGGALNLRMPRGQLQERYPLYYSLKQLMTILGPSANVRRIDVADQTIRYYEVTNKAQTYWVAWLDQQAPHIPGKTSRSRQVTLPVTGEFIDKFTLQVMEAPPAAETLRPRGSGVRIEIGVEPVVLRARP